MVNLAVIKLKDIMKIMIKFCIVVLGILFLFFLCKKVKFSDILTQGIQTINEHYAQLLDANSGIAQIEESEEFDLEMFMLETEMQHIEEEKKTVEMASSNDEQAPEIPSQEIESAEKQEAVQEVATNAQVTVIEENNIAESYNQTYGSVKIKNESSYTLNDAILTPDIQLNNKTDIIIYHTHTCESYTPTEANPYTPSGTYRTIDLNHSVARVGTELTNRLTGYGYRVVHSTDFHDYPAYSGSYNRSLKTANSLLASNASTEIAFDLHRDAVGSKSNYAPKVKIGDTYAAQIMFVIGTDGGGLNHPNWQQNLKFAIKVQEKANELYPGLLRPIIVRNSRYNQHITKAASIIEVGATGNTLEECINSMEYFSQILNEVLKN